MVKYAGLLADAAKESNKIIKYLGLSKSPEKVSTAIYNQSFKVKKENMKSLSIGRIHSICAEEYLENGEIRCLESI